MGFQRYGLICAFERAPGSIMENLFAGLTRSAPHIIAVAISWGSF
jgi:hypothetical protein